MTLLCVHPLQILGDQSPGISVVPIPVGLFPDADSNVVQVAEGIDVPTLSLVRASDHFDRSVSMPVAAKDSHVVLADIDSLSRCAVVVHTSPDCDAELNCSDTLNLRIGFSETPENGAFRFASSAAPSEKLLLDTPFRRFQMRLLLLLFACWVAPLSAQTRVVVKDSLILVVSKPDTVVKTVVRVDTLRLPLPSKAPTIPIGPYHASLALIGTTLTGTLRYGDPLNWKAQLDSVRGKGSIFFALFTDRKGFLATRADGKKIFDEAKWRAVFDSVWATKPISPYLADGTIAAVYPFDEPNCGSCWGLDDSLAITPAQIDRLSGYIKSKWPYATIAVRVIPQWLENTPNVDVAWAQYEGPHLPSNKMTAKQFADSNVRAAKARGLGLVLALNVLDGGDGSSKVNGTFFQDPNPLDSITKDARGNVYRYRMSPSEVRAIGKTFAAEPYACGVTGWKDHPDFTAAWAEVAQVQRVFTPCRRP